MNLQLGCQGYMALQYHMEEAYLENNLDPNTASCTPPIAIFSNKYYNEINKIRNNKIHNFCFIGSIMSDYENRKWIIDFAKKYFTSNSIYINTDNDTNCELLGDYDYSKKSLGFNPKIAYDSQSKKVQYRIIQENLFYFQTMRQSKFILCPAGDSPWSFRFYETLMCKSIPIVQSWHHTYRTSEESTINYEYILADNIESINDISYNNLVDKNTSIFKQFHLLNYTDEKVILI